jgi:hypothetical protein
MGITIPSFRIALAMEKEEERQQEKEEEAMHIEDTQKEVSCRN